MAILIQIVTPDETKTIELTNESISIGRSRTADCTILSEELLSRQHLEFYLHISGSIFVKDLNSKNGTILNGLKILKETPFYIGDIIRIGEMTVILDRSQMNEKELKLHTRPGKKALQKIATPDKSITGIVHNLNYTEDPNTYMPSTLDGGIETIKHSNFEITRTSEGKGLLSKHKKKNI